MKNCQVAAWHMKTFSNILPNCLDVLVSPRLEDITLFILKLKEHPLGINQVIFFISNIYTLKFKTILRFPIIHLNVESPNDQSPEKVPKRSFRRNITPYSWYLVFVIFNLRDFQKYTGSLYSSIRICFDGVFWPN